MYRYLHNAQMRMSMTSSTMNKDRVEMLRCYDEPGSILEQMRDVHRAEKVSIFTARGQQ